MGKRLTSLNLNSSHSSQMVWGRQGELGRKKILEMCLLSSGVIMTFRNGDHGNNNSIYHSSSIKDEKVRYWTVSTT